MRNQMEYGLMEIKKKNGNKKKNETLDHVRFSGLCFIFSQILKKFGRFFFL